MRRLTAALALAATLPAAAEAVPVRVVGENGAYHLLRGGEPYVVKGAGVAGMDFATVAARGGNSVRTWGVEMIQAKLDAAERNGLTVAVNLPVTSERHGFDYDDAAAVAAQRERIETLVRRYRDHSALLAWILGNELDFGHGNPRVWDAVNALSQAIHRLDPHHPTTTAISGADPALIDTVLTRAPDLDFVSVQLYGALALLPGYADGPLEDVPFMVTEWGPLGFWEVANTAWGAPLEQHSSVKAAHYLKGYQRFIAPLLPGPALGSYTFLWGQKQERTPTWFSLFTETGESTEVVDAMQLAWTGAVPENRAPTVAALRLNGQNASDSVRLTAGRSYPAEALFADPDGDALVYEWRVKPESTAQTTGGDFEPAIADLPGLIAANAGSTATIRAPAEAGAYRLFATAYDDHGHAAYANVPFLVLPPTPR